VASVAVVQYTTAKMPMNDAQNRPA